MQAISWLAHCNVWLPLSNLLLVPESVSFHTQEAAAAEGFMPSSRWAPHAPHRRATSTVAAEAATGGGLQLARLPGAADQAQHATKHHGTELQADGSRTTLNLGVWGC